MPLHYCSLHGRVLSVLQQRWLAFPQEKIREVKEYYTLLCSTTTDPSFLQVCEMPCDQCAAPLETRARSTASPEGS